MAAPAVTVTYPADEDTGIPVGAILTIQFDRGIDLAVAKQHVVLYGADFDVTSGPESATWIRESTGENPYFLRSPGFKGIVDCDYEVVYVDLDSDAEVDPGAITGEADELAYGLAGVGHMLKVTPQVAMAPDVDYVMYIIGDPDSTDRGISARTVFDLEANVGNVSTTGDVIAHGSYTGSVADTINIQITTGGDIGTAKYKWWYTSLGVGSATLARTTSRRNRRLDDGVQVRFSGSGFAWGDRFAVNVEPLTRLVVNYKIDFSTNDGSYSTAPASPSTPATSTPPPIGGGSGTGSPGSTSSRFFVVEMTPIDRSYNNPLSTREIVIEFSDDLDSRTITGDTVKVYRYPVSGLYDGQPSVLEMEKQLTVSDSTLTINI